MSFTPRSKQPNKRHQQAAAIDQDLGQEAASRMTTTLTPTTITTRTKRRTKTLITSQVALFSSPLSLICLLLASQCLVSIRPEKAAALEDAAAGSGPLPGVSRELQTFCSSRPSLPIDLATMIVHIKKNTSFNYKLYLFSGDDYVFQTGQIVPRDDFRIHSFPVKVKKLSEFWPQNVPLFREAAATSKDGDSPSSNAQLTLIKNSKFDPRRFLSLVPNELGDSSEHNFNHHHLHKKTDLQPEPSSIGKRQIERRQTPPHDVAGEPLPGDEPHYQHQHHDVAFAKGSDPPSTTTGNEHIQFDRDDQLAPLNRLSARNRRLESTKSDWTWANVEEMMSNSAQVNEKSVEQRLQMLMPLGAFSSFNVNSTYLVRKDFGQRSAEIIRIVIDAYKFQVIEVHLIGAHEAAAPEMSETPRSDNATLQAQTADELSFLNHKLLRDPQTRIVSINQIYEDWITRNFYTVVYIQRKLNHHSPDNNDSEMDEVEKNDNDDDGGEQPGKRSEKSSRSKKEPEEIVTDRLVFRGSSMVLLGADQLDYPVKASAFITEKNGLHYFLEFLAQKQKFLLGAVDWSKRPFKIIDTQAYPMKHTQTQYDNEELLLCPPSICYSEQPIDEIIAYGRIALDATLQQEASILIRSSSSSMPKSEPINDTNHMADLLLLSGGGDGLENGPESRAENVLGRKGGESTINLDRLIHALRAGARSLDLRLHLRDWVWSLDQKPRQSKQRQQQQQQLGRKENISFHVEHPHQFQWRFERAKRNELKANKDTYGFALSGHEIDASYRVYNELYLISANQLISVDYTQANGTVISSRPVQDSFPGLSSTLVDPITAAFYERHANQLYFFKGDRYVGYDYATKRPLDEFQLSQASVEHLAQSQPVGGGGSSEATKMMMMLMMMNDRHGPARTSTPSEALVATLPVVGILGRQHPVDAIYHDQSSDFVYIFSGMKYYSYQASEFKDGAFSRHAEGEIQLPQMECINQHFLLGCQFDAAYPNPCQTGQKAPSASGKVSSANNEGDDINNNDKPLVGRIRFSQEQQSRLRSIATGRQGGLLEFLVDNALVNGKAASPLLLASPPLDSSNLSLKQQQQQQQQNQAAVVSSMFAANQRHSLAQERIVICILLAMVFITILVTLVAICAIVHWTKSSKNSKDSKGTQDKSSGFDKMSMGQTPSPKLSPPRRPNHQQTTSASTVAASLIDVGPMQLQHYSPIGGGALNALPPRIQQVLLEQQQQQHQFQQQPLHYATSWLHKQSPRTHTAARHMTNSQFSVANLKAGQTSHFASNKKPRQQQPPPVPSIAHLHQHLANRTRQQLDNNDIVDSSAL